MKCVSEVVRGRAGSTSKYFPRSACGLFAEMRHGGIARRDTSHRPRNHIGRRFGRRSTARPLPVAPQRRERLRKTLKKGARPANTPVVHLLGVHRAQCGGQFSRFYIKIDARLFSYTLILDLSIQSPWVEWAWEGPDTSGYSPGIAVLFAG